MTKLGKYWGLSALLLAWSVAANAESPQYRIHGFAAQGFVYSNGNEFYGTSTDGSWEYYEAGVNGTLQFSGPVSLSGQLLVRDAGATDNSSLRTDFLFVDYRALELPEGSVGIRLGRVRNDYGFYNSTRDVLFTRPSVLLPQSTYYEGNGVREILFSVDGLQFYSHWNRGRHNSGFSVSLGKSEELSRDLVSNLFGSLDPAFISNPQVTRDSPIFAQYFHDIDGGAWRMAVSYMGATLDASALVIGTPLNLSIHYENYVLSLQRNWEFFTVTSEYTSKDFKTSGFGQERKTRSEGIYVQGEYRISPSVTLMSRYDVDYGDVQDRNDTDSRDLTVGVSWQPHPSWLLTMDVHKINGTAGIPLRDNPNGLDDDTELLLIMAGYRF